MKSLLHPDMVEAARLTRAGRLSEATALIRRVLGGDADTTRHGAEHVVPTIDLTREEYTAPVGQTAPSATTDASRPSMRSTLRSVVGHLGSIGDVRRNHGGFTPQPAASPGDANFRVASVTAAAGRRDYKLYTPRNLPDGPRPLIVMLHGCTQSADDFAAGTGMNTLAEAHGFYVAYPIQVRSANAQLCWNWFKPEHQRRDTGEPALLAGIVKQISADAAVDPRRIYMAGFSAGAAAAAVMAATYPDVFAAVGLHSGVPVGVASDLPSALTAMRDGNSTSSRPSTARAVPAIVFHGDQDRIVNPRNASGVIDRLLASQQRPLRSAPQAGQVPGGHGYTRTDHVDENGRTVMEQWMVHGAGHAWSGGSPTATYTDPRGPSASREMVRFFLQHDKLG